ncbi:DMT family transporter [Shouchella shacheensis]|nr:DMT family transporter [Shouchella shacheensis]
MNTTAIAGQVLTSMIMDHLGLFGAKLIPITFTRVAAFL